ncbi:MAG: trigger factor [Rhodospirillales bacterium]
MQITETNTEGLKREFRVVVPAGDIDAKMDGRLRELSGSVNMPGFRPGKVPMTLIKKRYGPSVRGEVLEQTISDSVQQAVSQSGARPAMEPKIEIVSFEDGRDLEYTLQIEVLPEVKPVDFSTVALERVTAEVSDADVDETVQRLAEQRREYEPVTDGRGAEEGDELLVDFTVRIGEETITKQPMKDFPIRLGSKMPSAEFDDQLKGAKAGQKVAVSMTVPETHSDENMRGKTAVYDVDVKEVRAPKSVSVDDALATAMGLENLAALKKTVREQMERDYGQVSRANLKRKLLDQLSKAHSFEVPPGMVDREFEAIWSTIADARAKGELDEDDKDKSEDDLKARYRPIAERRVRLGLLLAEVGRASNLQVTQDDINRAISQQARQFPGQEARVFEYYQQNPNALQELQAPIFEDKVVDYILEMAKVSDRRLPVPDFTKEIQDFKEDE